MTCSKEGHNCIGLIAAGKIKTGKGGFMKLKYYLRGLGVGIILTTLIISISGSQRKLSDNEIITRAMELGMIMKEDPKGNLDQVMEASGTITPALSKEPDQTPEPDEENQPEESMDTNQDQPEENPEETGETDETGETGEEAANEGEAGQQPEGEPAQAPSAPAAAADTEELAAEPNDTQTNVTITFTIEKGMSSGKVAAMLESIGLIQNAEEFNDYIIRKGKAGAIMIGRYTLPGDASYEDILKTITE